MNLTLDTLEFRSPITDFPKRDGGSVGLLISQVWQRRLRSLWQFVQGLRATATLDFPNTDAQQSSDLTVAVAGAAVGDFVQVAPPVASVLANSCYWGFVSAAGVVTVRFCNFSAGALNPPSGIFQIRVTSQ